MFLKDYDALLFHFVFYFLYTTQICSKIEINSQQNMAAIPLHGCLDNFIFPSKGFNEKYNIQQLLSPAFYNTRRPICLLAVLQRTGNKTSLVSMPFPSHHDDLQTNLENLKTNMILYSSKAGSSGGASAVFASTVIGPNPTCSFVKTIGTSLLLLPSDMC